MVSVRQTDAWEGVFKVITCYGVHENLVRPIERIYHGSIDKFYNVTTGWCKMTLEFGRAAPCHLSILTYMSGN